MRNKNLSMQIGKYKIVRELGSGTYGKAYQASYDDLMYTIKHISMKNAIYVMMEVSLYNILSHPHIISPYEYFTEDGGKTMNIVLPLMDRSLGSYLNDKKPIPMAEENLRSIVWQILCALDYMHLNKIIHRDLNPENILMNSSDAKIIDLGLSTYLFPGAGNTRNIVQTFTHRAPEVFKAEDDPKIVLTPKMDIWSIGIIMIDMILGKYFASFYEGQVREKFISKPGGDSKGTLHSDIDELKCSTQCKDVMHEMLLRESI